MYNRVGRSYASQATGVRPEDVSHRFASRMELTLAALELPPALPAARHSRLSGVETVLRFLRLWETGANAGILTNVLRAGMRDGRSRREVEDVLAEVLFVSLATGLGNDTVRRISCSPDAADAARAG